MKAEETRKNLMQELNAEFSRASRYVATPKEEVPHFPLMRFEKPKMFEPKGNTTVDTPASSFEANIGAIRGMGFQEKPTKTNLNANEKKEPVEIYSMKELTNSHPENMRTLSINPKEIKAELALVKKKDWQEVLFGDVDWFQPIHFKNIFKI